MPPALRDFLHDTDNALLLVALLLAVWLWLLQRRHAEEARRPTRTTALTVDELARTVFLAARSGDLHAYRDLFLNGAEAASIGGRAWAEEWLARRSPAALEDSLATLGALIPPGAVFESAERLDGDRCVMRVRPPEGSPIDVDLGRLAQVGPAWRLREIVRDRAPARHRS